MRPQLCDPSDMYITEEWFRLDLLRSYVAVKSTLPGEKPTCAAYDTSEFPTGSDDQVTEFSW